MLSRHRRHQAASKLGPDASKARLPALAADIDSAPSSAGLSGTVAPSLSTASDRTAETGGGGGGVDVSDDAESIQVDSPVTLAKNKSASLQWKNDAFAPGMPSSFSILIGWLQEDNNYDRWKGSEGDGQLPLAGDIVQRIVKNKCLSTRAAVSSKSPHGTPPARPSTPGARRGGIATVA
ncbi:hypothetical protein V8E36_009364 [Tilletia maclaganii]